MDLLIQSPTSVLPFAQQPWLHSNDLDEAAYLLNSHLEERRLTAVSSAQAQIHFTRHCLEHVQLFGAGWGMAVQVCSSPLQNWHAIMPVAGAVSSLDGGYTATAGELLLFRPGHEARVHWHARAKALVMNVDTSRLSGHAQAHHQLDLAALRGAPVLHLQTQHPGVRTLGNLVRFAEQELAAGAGLFGSALGRQQLCQLFYENLLQVMPQAQAPAARALPGVVKRAQDYIHSHLQQPLDMAQLVAVAGASRRTLEQAFRSSLGSSPQRYAQQQRLHALRAILLSHRPGEIQLTELAYRWGFSQPSHFTAAYKQAFGELPSYTLQQL